MGSITFPGVHIRDKSSQSGGGGSKRLGMHASRCTKTNEHRADAKEEISKREQKKCGIMKQ